MERNRDLRRATVSAVNGPPRRRQRVTTLRDPTDEDRRMELQETVRLDGVEREFPKKRRIDRSEVQQRSDGGESYRENSTDSSDEEYYEEEEDMRIQRTNQLTPLSSSLSKNRCGLRKLRSSPVLRAAVNEMFGVPVPRRARSSSTKRLHEYCNSGSSGFGEDLSRRRSSPCPVSLNGSGDSMKMKMRSVERITTPTSNPHKLSAIQDDIEIEVAEALFDLMKQSQSQSHSSLRRVDRDSVIPASNELKMSKADDGKDENNAFSVQNEPSIKANAETVLADSMKELKNEGTVVKEKFSDDSARDLASGDGFVNKAKVGSSKESETLSCVKVNACDIQDPTLAKAHYDAIVVEAKKETKLEIDLMVSPLPSSPEREVLVDTRTDHEPVSQAARNRSEIILKDGPLAVASGIQGEKTGEINSNQELNLEAEKHNDGTSCHQAPASLLSFPYGMSGWSGVVPHPGFIPALHAVVPNNGSAKSSMITQPPQFKFAQSRPKRCATHQYLAHSINCHQQLIKKSLSSGSTGPAALRAKSLNPLLGDLQGGQNSAAASVRYVKDKSSDAAVAFKATTSSKPLLQQASTPVAPSSFLHGPGFVLPLGHHQAATLAPANSSGSPQSASLLSNSAGRLPGNLGLHNASTATSLNLPMFPSDEAASYMAMLHNNGCSVPISTNIPMPSFKGGPPSMAFLNPSLYPSPAFNFTRDQHQRTTAHASVQSASQNTIFLSHQQPQSLQQQTVAKVSDNKFPTPATVNSQPEKPGQQSQLSSKSDTEINWKNGASIASGFVSHSVKLGNLQTCSLSAQPMNSAMIPTMSVGGGSKQIEPSQQNCKGRMELIPQAFGLSFDSNASATPLLNFSSMAQTSAAMFQMLPDMARNGNQMTQQKNFQASEGKYTGGQPFNYSKLERSAVRSPSLARHINFLPSSVTASDVQQQQHQLIQVQDFHVHLAGRGQAKSSTPHNIAGSFFTSSSPVYAPNDTPSSFPRSAAAAPEVKTSQGQTHINFGNGFQGHQFIMKNESMSQSPQEAEAKASPGCRRSILSTRPNQQLPELKN